MKKINVIQITGGIFPIKIAEKSEAGHFRGGKVCADIFYRERTMRIIHVCYHDIRGGAALAARRLHLELLRTGHESRFMLVEQSGDTEQAIRLPALFRCRCRIEQRLEALAFRHANRNRLTPQSLNLFPTSIAARINRENPDVVNLHWINGASSAIWDLPRIHAPVVWTLHDTWPYCATEHYHDNNDLRFVTGYREPAPNGSFWQPLVWKCKRKNWNGWTPEIVAPSNWIAGEAQSSELMHRLPITPIANGVDLAVFRPSDRLKARQTLRLPPNARIILFGAYNAADRNKGGPELTAALRRLSRRFSEPLLLLAVGSNTKMPDFGIPTVFTGRLDTEQQMATAYAAADATVLASKYDNLPNIRWPAAFRRRHSRPAASRRSWRTAFPARWPNRSSRNRSPTRWRGFWSIRTRNSSRQRPGIARKAVSTSATAPAATPGCTPDCGNVFHRLPDTPSARRSDPGNHGKSTIFSQWDLTNATLFGIILL